MLSSIIICLVIAQRLVELLTAKRNEKWILQQGGYEVGASHYPWMVAMHTLFFVFLIMEVFLFNRPLFPYWELLIIVFLLVQLARVWCLVSLGKFWNTKIMILEQAKRVQKGPYRWLNHPNYLIVTIELLVLPTLLGAYYTAVLFTFLNILMLKIRIPIEEQALQNAFFKQTSQHERESKN